MKRLAPLALILLFVVCTTGCRRGLRLWGLRGAPCQPAGAAAPGLGGGPFAGALGGGGLGGGALGAPQMPMGAPMGAPMASPTCCPPVDCCPPIDCGCATEGLPMDPAYGGINGGIIGGGQALAGQVPSGMPGVPLADGTEVPVSDSGYNIQPGEWLAPAGAGGTANVAPSMPANLPPSL